jgi:hypothetical protein
MYFSFEPFAFLLCYVKACRPKLHIQDLEALVLWIQNFVCKCKRMELILFTTDFPEEELGLIGSKG